MKKCKKQTEGISSIDLAKIYGVTVGRFRSCRLLLNGHPEPISYHEKPHKFHAIEIEEWLSKYNPIEEIRKADMEKRRRYNRVVTSTVTNIKKIKPSVAYQRSKPMAQGVPNVARLW